MSLRLRAHGARGKVFLAGAGPGDPELLTLKVHRLLREANVVLHDDLVPAEIASLARAQAIVQKVGKWCGVKRITQDDINRLMVESAQRGLQVLRLKSGDPTIFGRLNEEIDALAAAGVEFEVVPGITAGAAAAAALGVSMTDRRASSRVVIVSGHHARGDTSGAPQYDYDWSAIARSDETVVIYMPGGELGALSAKIATASEISTATPCAIVSRAGTATQRVHWTTLAGLRNAPVLPAPTILLIGRSLAGAAARAAAPAVLPRHEESTALVAALGAEFYDEIFGTEERRAGL
jgi:uroporphyrin-III C-methyltransferase